MSRAKGKPRKLVTYEIESRHPKGRWIITGFGTDELNARELYGRTAIRNRQMNNPRHTKLVKRTMTIEDEVIIADE